MSLQAIAIKLACAGLHYAKMEDDANPDVGMGPSLEMLLTRYLKEAEVPLSEALFNQVLSRYRLIYGRNG